jgi:hypothetical protein
MIILSFIMKKRKKKKKEKKQWAGLYDQVVSLDGQRLMARSWVFDHGDPRYGHAFFFYATKDWMWVSMAREGFYFYFLI